MLNQNEILKVADIVSQEKGIELDIVMQAMEESFEIIAKSKYGLENNIKAVIDRFTGNFKLTHIKDVVETFDPVLQSNQILLEQAYSKVLKEDHDEDDHNRDDDSNIFHSEDTLIFNDPMNLPYSYDVSYEKKMERGFYDDSVVGVEINSAKAYKKDSDEVEFLFD